MSEFTGILNENEFYTTHYVQAILEGDLRCFFERFAGEKSPPWEALRGLHSSWKEMRQDIDRLRGVRDRLERQLEWFAALFGVLG